MLLCRRHHTILHRDGYEIVLDSANKLAFVRPDGAEMARALSPQFADLGDDLNAPPYIEAEHLDLGLNIDANTAITAWLGERMDYGFAVGTLQDIEDRSRGRAGAS